MEKVWGRMIPLVMFSLIILLITGVTSVEAEEDTGLVEWNQQYNVPGDKSWTISFNTPIEDTTQNKQAIYVTDRDGEHLAAHVTVQGTQVVVEPPEEGYLSAQTYELHIEKSVTSSAGMLMNKTVVMPFTISEEVLFEEGDWSWSTTHGGATLTISDLTDESFTFAINASNGARADYIEGTASIHGNQATYRDENGCKVDFTLAEKTIQVETDLTSSDCYYGGSVVFEGEYHQPGYEPPEEEKTMFVENGIFTPTENQRFIELTGEHYSRFESTFHLTWDTENEDPFPAIVTSAMVQGLGNFMEGIIMNGDNGEIYAAMIGEDPRDILYFTTDPAYVKEVPKTITSWVNRLDGEHTIRYMSE